MQTVQTRNPHTRLIEYRLLSAIGNGKRHIALVAKEAALCPSAAISKLRILKKRHSMKIRIDTREGTCQVLDWGTLNPKDISDFIKRNGTETTNS